MSRVQVDWKERVAPLLMKQFGYTSIMAVPKLEKIVLNMGVGEAASNAKEIEDAVADMTLIAGQKPVVTKTKKAIANFKIREDQPIGCKVTLRGIRMYDFFDKLVSIDLPRVRDFHGIPTNSFDGRGNYALGIKEQLIFPEIDYDKISHLRGMDIIIVTSAKTDKEAYALLEALGMPFRK
ncbi:MAG: 50S ribosomal protein L5 [Bacilli bacterium]|nr:50S ribosomal protein L5 [Bacilli bacterium]